MTYTSEYHSPIGKILLASDGEALTGLWFEGQKYFAAGLGEDINKSQVPCLAETKRWLDIYFCGEKPDFMPKIKLIGTDFQKEVWELLIKIPYGKTTTYKELARMIALKRGIKSMSAQAVGSAVGRNKISVIIPCHRVLGADGSLTGYAGGVDKKRWLLDSEGIVLGQNTIFSF